MGLGQSGPIPVQEESFNSGVGLILVQEESLNSVVGPIPVQDESLNSGAGLILVQEDLLPRSRRLTQHWGSGQSPFKKNHSTMGFVPLRPQEELRNKTIV